MVLSPLYMPCGSVVLPLKASWLIKPVPAAHTLTNQEAYPNQIKERQDGNAADLGHQAANTNAPMTAP